MLPHLQIKDVARFSMVTACWKLPIASCLLFTLDVILCLNVCIDNSSQSGAADAEIKVSSGENTELKRSPFKGWGRSEYSHTCYAYCQGFPPFLFLSFRSIHLHFFPKPLPISPVLTVANTWFLCRPAEKKGYPAGRRFPC